MDVLLVVAEADDPVSLETVEAQAPRIVEGLLRGLDKSKGSNEVSPHSTHFLSIQLQSLTTLLPALVRCSALSLFRSPDAGRLPGRDPV